MLSSVCVSRLVFPIGLYVLLSNNKIGQVIDVNPENPKYPIVQLVGETKPDGSKKIVETSEYGLKIIRPLSKEEGASLVPQQQ